MSELGPTVYDEHSQFYLDFVDRALLEEGGPLHVLMSTIETLLGDRLRGARVCDVGCGEGYLGRYLVRGGAREVLGIDSSAALIEAATARSNAPNLEYRVDDAHVLQTVPDASVDVVVSQLAVMDVADHQRMFRATRRVLTAKGVFVFSLLHPCFEGRPFHLPEEPPFIRDEEGVPVAYVVHRYGSEGFWQSGGDGVRGHMGSYHRMLSTYINDLLASDFRLERVEEPLLPDAGLFSQVPLYLVIAARVE